MAAVVVVAVVAVVVVAIVLLVLLFFVANQLPDDIEAFQKNLSTDTPAQLRILILGCSIAVLTLVAFVLCVVGLFLPRRPRLLAGAGAIISFLILAGVFGVLLVGGLMNPDQPPTSASEESRAAETEQAERG